MKKNVGIADKAVRIVVALILAVLYFTEVISGTIGIVALVAGGIFLATSLINFCPLYMPFGISTCKKTTETAS